MAPSPDDAHLSPNPSLSSDPTDVLLENDTLDLIAKCADFSRHHRDIYLRKVIDRLLDLAGERPALPPFSSHHSDANGQFGHDHCLHRRELGLEHS